MRLSQLLVAISGFCTSKVLSNSSRNCAGGLCQSLRCLHCSISMIFSWVEALRPHVFRCTHMREHLPPLLAFIASTVPSTPSRFYSFYFYSFCFYASVPDPSAVTPVHACWDVKTALSTGLARVPKIGWRPCCYRPHVRAVKKVSQKV